MVNTFRYLAVNRTPARVDHIFRRLQLVSAALYSLGHGTNDAQKTMGIIAGAVRKSSTMPAEPLTETGGGFPAFEGRCVPSR